MWAFGFHLILTFPSEFKATFGFPPNLNNWNATSLELLNFSIHDLHSPTDRRAALPTIKCFERSHVNARVIAAVIRELD
ncbi:hypothetical protein L1987_15585 [Smallanthus sonchifolius]|uniref:Uncharacterized protein n=1 Tax=Smallanthus sonchifolius TaxID=185202 RepID=A0ACB9J6D3_9ASTR|nr:hypothetical protein L1987_15585 [Smallanthus sonchifolius]